MARYQYETSPRKIRTDYEPVKKKVVKKNYTTKSNTSKKSTTKMKTAKKLKIVLFVLIGFLAFFTISFRNAMIDSKYAEIKKLKNNLALVEKENEQLKINIEKTLNLNNVEQSAKEMLGMQKLDNSQKVYINLPKKDYIESNVEEVIMEEGNTFWQKIIKNISKFIK